jgi:NAD(P)-dependent dehydrogenase (short-subunit alcohol dehydrogenase family)
MNMVNTTPPRSQLSFEGRVAVITGAGRGLGYEYGLRLAERGAKVVINDLGVALDGEGGDSSLADLAAKEVLALGGSAVADTNSVSTPDGARALISTALDNFGRLDILINNAGIVADSTFHKLDLGRVADVLAVHLQGTFNVTAAAWPLMREQGYGRVINTSSTSGLFGNFGQGAYAAAKSGVVGLTRVLALEGAKRGILVNAIAPGAVTRMTPDGSGLDAAVMSPSAVSPMVVYLAHESCEVTGEVYRAAGGHVARIFIGITAGHSSGSLTPEEVRDNLPAIRDLDGFRVPSSALDPGMSA